MVTNGLFTPIGTRLVKVSAKSVRLPFNGCEPDYIKNVCKAACCRSSARPEGALIAVTRDEARTIVFLGQKVRGGLIVTVNKRCPFQKTDDHLCSLHGTPAKPTGCIASPFFLNRNDTLVIRHRYLALKCFNDGHKLPAYVAFRSSLNMLFGTEEAIRVCTHIASGGGDLTATMLEQHYQMLKHNFAVHHDKKA